MRIFVVHNDLSVRASLETLAAGAQCRVDSCSDAVSLLALLPIMEPACLILSTDLPDIDGLQLQSLLAGRPDLPVIFVADRPSVRTVVQAMKAGAIEVLTTPIDEQALLGAIHQALQRSATVRARDEERRALHRKYQQLSRRERQVMQLVIRGRLNKHIAAELGISEITVKTHRGKVMRKMQADSVPHLVNMSSQLLLQHQHESWANHVESDRSPPAGIHQCPDSGVRHPIVCGG
jgi:FixJ family two-component response regulator